MSFCSKTAAIWQMVGKIIVIVKITVPLILIILGMIDFFKAITSSDDKAISKSVRSLVTKVIAGILIFFVPTLVNVAFSLVGAFKSDLKKDYDTCRVCLLNPDKCDVTYKPFN